MSMTGFPSVVAATVSGAFVVGMVLVLLESTQQVLAKRLNLSEGRVEWLLASMNLSLIPMMLISGLVIDHWEVKPVLIVGSIATSAAVLTLAMSETTGRVFGSILLLGAGGACLSTSSIVLMLRAFDEAHPGAAQNLGNVFFAAGALVSPMLAGRLLERFQYRRALTMLAVVCLLPALLAALTAHDAFPTPVAGPAAYVSVFAQPVLWLAAFLFLLYRPLEDSLGTWAGRYLSDRGFSEILTERIRIGFWLAFLAGRFLAFLLEQRPLTSAIGQSWFIAGLGLAAAVSLGNMAGARKGFNAALGVILVGLFFGPIFPTLVGILFHQLPSQRGTAYGAMFAIGSVGNFFLPQLIGSYARKNTVQRAMRIPMGLALVLSLGAVVLALCLPLL
jgi:fucose permease